MQKQTSVEIVFLACLLAGCTTMPWTETQPTEQPEPSGVWIQNSRAYAAEIASSRERERERLRQQALYDYLKAPSAEQQVRLSLVYEAATQTLMDAYAAADSLSHALGQSSVWSANVRAVLTSLQLRVERRLDDLHAIASRESELAAVRDANRVLEESKAARDAQYAGVQRALRDAEAKLEALKSIEQTLESNSAQGSAEPEAPDGAR